ncbi:MAG: hypothetical protein P0Y65_13715 [Candidatus Devosia phytovorans]|uniref:Uncharacterized protein n=1 Tax=Candidatus Devosia phytovorans TaxID=3121372 RepID=A0AAJ5VSD9_9HYPH|nr:hypothetical protein [Devosia sp.]WEK03250.1 MAG: hypothetical protein P0Y65_13715 [Devosia sp.]
MARDDEDTAINNDVHALLPIPVAAQSCFVRNYSDDHLQAHPGHQVAQIIALHTPGDVETKEDYDIRIRFRDDKREFAATTYCEDIDGTTTCMIECDGGVVLPSIDQYGQLRLSTEYLRAKYAGVARHAAGCAEPVTRSIADVSPSGEAVPTLFLMHPDKLHFCDWSRR